MQIITKGICSNCKVTYSKRSMKRHIGSCYIKEKTDPDKQSRDLRKYFHLRIQDKYSPFYWIHVLIQSDIVLFDLDRFLRDLWVECCGHLSSFIINKVDYKSYSPDIFDDNDEDFDDEEDDEDFDDEEDDEEDEILTNCNLECKCHVLSDILDRVVEEKDESFVAILSEFPGSDLFETENYSNFMDFLIQAIYNDTQFKNLDLETITKQCECLGECHSNVILHGIRAYEEFKNEGEKGEDDDDGDLNTFDFIKSFFETSLSEEMYEKHQTMDIKISEVLNEKVKKFFYVYDYGSTTDLEISIQEVIELPNNLNEIMLLARNEMPTFQCDHCTKPSVVLCSECNWDGAGMYCRSCLKKHNCGEESVVDQVNSPRMGICGYN